MSDWRMLRAVAGILKVIAWIDAIVGGIIVLFVLFGGLSTALQYSSYGGGLLAGGSLLIALLYALGVVIGFIFTMAAAELILLFISLEEHSGVMVSTLKDLASTMRSMSLTPRQAGGQTLPPGR